MVLFRIYATPALNTEVLQSKKSLNFFTNLNGSPSLRRKKSAHKEGVKVRATKPDMVTDIAKVRANCL